jgi:N-acyl-L-homoserine lactone synthetase
MVQVIVGSDNSECRPQLEEMFRQRYQIFIVEKGWKLDTKNGLEIDTYDTPDSIYLLEYEKSGKLGASMRANATHEACMLAELFADMCEQEIPRGPDIWELTRGALSADLRRSGIYGRVMCSMFEAGLLWGAKKGIGIVTVEYLMRQIRFGMDARPLGPPRQIDGEPHVATVFDFSIESLSRLRATFGIKTPVIERLHLRPTRAAA